MLDGLMRSGYDRSEQGLHQASGEEAPERPPQEGGGMGRYLYVSCVANCAIIECYMCVFIVVHHIACYAHVVRCFGV